MKKTFGRLLQTLLIDEIDPAELIGINDELMLAYLECERRGENAAQRYPQMAIALQQSKTLRTEYDELKALLDDELIATAHCAVTANPVITGVATNLTRHSSGQPVHTDSARTGSVRESSLTIWQREITGRVTIRLSSDALQISRSPQMALSFAKERSEDAEQELYRYQISNEIDDLNVEIVVRSNRENAENCTVVVNADIPSRGGWPNLEHTAVTLRRDEQLIATQYSDPFGEVVFPAVPLTSLPVLTFEILPAPA